MRGLGDALVPTIAKLFALTDQGRRSIKKLRALLLIIHHKHDQTADPVPSHWVDRPSDHVVTTGSERNEVFQLALMVMENVVAGTARSADAPRVEPGETSLDR
jgi:hypothetical protein